MKRILSLGIPSVFARSPRPQLIIWLEVHSDSSSPFQAAIDANGSIIAWL